ncbi:CopD family protein [Pseudoduganella sp. OTU4001]|uniref:CopD family protein n=1 Tax=Pseudoduganella sp. OTU4001 TaxID=3043854 RepID=UPI00313BE256
MMDPVLMLQAMAAFMLSVGYCWLVGSLIARRWLVGRAGGGDAVRQLRTFDLWASGLAIVGALLVLMAGAAAMSGLPLADAYQALLPMLGTDFGRTGCVVLLALIALFGLRWFAPSGAWWSVELGGLLLLTFARASMGHAGEAGLLTATHVMEALHLASIGAWLGIVLVSAGPALAPSAPMVVDGGDANRYLARMSDAAMVAVLVVAVTGAYNGWHRIGSVGALLPANGYVMALTVKLSMVAVALCLGGFNKLFGLPMVVRDPRAQTTVRALLQIEAVVLLAALFAASWLTILAPPTAA